jgi:2-polyprenyl-6-methoxyphenol hydroxylase-like FAD-dependent oxidoreductase
MDDQGFDVIVVGAGPVGLALALELGLAGASVAVIERLRAPDLTIKAGGLGALAGEALERRGLGPALDAEERATAAAMIRMATGADPGPDPPLPWRKLGGHFAGLFLIDQERQREPTRWRRGVAQQGLERMLHDRLAEQGVVARRSVELVGFEDDGALVRATVDEAGQRSVLRARYLVGCDGGRSFVRKRAGFAFPGTDPTLTGHQALVELDHPERLLPLGWRRTPGGMLAYGPTPGRIFVAELDGPPADRDAPVTIAEVEASLRRVSGADVRITAMKTATRFTDNARQATTYRMGRVLLAGDAAHVHSPFGGQGLDLGLLDAMNLGWKLAAVVQGRAPDVLLDTYTRERHPVAAAVLANTRAQAALMRPDPLTTELREIVARILALDEGNRFFGEMMSGLTTRYDLGDAHPLVGRLSADRPLLADDGGAPTLYARMHGGGAVLVDAGDGEAARLAAPWSPRVVTACAADGPSVLVRPDGCVAWARDPGDTSDLVPALERWLPR